MWGVWIEWEAFDDGHQKPAGRAWLHVNDEPILFACEHDAAQRAAVYRVKKTENGWQGYLAENLSIVQARRHAPTSTGERAACVPDLAALTGFFAP